MKISFKQRIALLLISLIARTLLSKSHAKFNVKREKANKAKIELVSNFMHNYKNVLDNHTYSLDEKKRSYEAFTVCLMNANKSFTEKRK